MRCRVSLSGSQQKDGESDEGEMVKAIVNFEDNSWGHGLPSPSCSRSGDHLTTAIPEGLNYVLLTNILIFPHINPEGFLFKINIGKALSKSGV